MKNFREIELLSSYLDGQLNTTEAKGLETRLTSDPELASVLKDLRATQNILRKLPARKAPRNFTLTRKMVGLKPPLPRAYPLFRFSTAFATILLMLTFAANSFGSLMSGAAAPAAYGYGGSGGGCDSCPEESALQAAAATEVPAAIEAPAFATEAPALEAPESAPSIEMQPLPTADGTLREADPAEDALQTPKEGESESGLQNQASAPSEAWAPSTLQIILLAVILLGGLVMWLMQRSASQKWL